MWDAVIRATPGRIAIVLMPDHLHVVHPLDVRVRLAAALSGFTRWRNHVRGEEGPQCAPVWTEPVEDDIKLRILIKYVHLNPCRSGLAPDPLAWPFSTHRDACGLALPGVVPQACHVAGFHRFVSSDPFVAIGGTPLPAGAVGVQQPFAVLDAVSALTRTPIVELRRRGPWRRLFLRAAHVLAPDARGKSIGDLVGATRDGAARAAARSKDGVQLVAKVLGDERFQALHTRAADWPGKNYRR